MGGGGPLDEAPRRDPVRVFGEMAIGFVAGVGLTFAAGLVVSLVAGVVGGVVYGGPEAVLAGLMVSVASAASIGCWCWTYLLPAAAVALVRGRGGFALGLVIAGVLPAMLTMSCAVPMVGGAL